MLELGEDSESAYPLVIPTPWKLVGKRTEPQLRAFGFV
jgi:hypothetical protein